MLTKTYRYWLYYYKKDKTLYAYTDDKKIAKEFEEERDMTQYSKRKEDITREDVNYLAMYYQNEILKIKEGVTKEHGIGSNTVPFHIVLTVYEDIMVTHYLTGIVEQKIPLCCWIPPVIFTKKYRCIMDAIGYTSKWLQIEYGDKIKVIQEKADYLSAFIQLYGDTMRI